MRRTSRMRHWFAALLLLNAATVAFAQAPHLAYSVLLGEDDWDAGDSARHIAVDGAGQAWVVAAGTQFTPAPGEDLYHGYSIVRLSPAGALLSTTPFGGSGADSIHSIHLDAAGNLYLVGRTTSPDFPMTHLVGPPGAINEAFVVKLDAAGDLVYSTRFRGTPSLPSLSLIDIAVDAQGRAHVVGKIAVSLYGASDIFVAKLSADG
ncbi:MAG TPA: SBBP repeat-containing protein, partial [Thermoanaerobaculia bacterium]|nr:SBBP repeat-containing protein [Thermoanaerobaculia bacterium]